MDITEKIVGIIKNPLGIIALFLTFIYGIAGSVIGPNFDNLTGEWERLPFIWFIILFPVVVLVVFSYLVIKHNEKLYSPGDFDNQDGFLIANGKMIKPHEEPKPLANPEIIPLETKMSHCLLMHDLSKEKDARNSRIEEASMARYSNEHNIDIKTEVRISKNLICDGVAKKDGKLLVFETKANYNPSQSSYIINALLKIKEAMKKKGNEEMYFILILVTDKIIGNKDIENLKIQMERITPQVEIVNYLKHDILNTIGNTN